MIKLNWINTTSLDDLKDALDDIMGNYEFIILDYDKGKDGEYVEYKIPFGEYVINKIKVTDNSNSVDYLNNLDALSITHDQVVNKGHEYMRLLYSSVGEFFKDYTTLKTGINRKLVTRRFILDNKYDKYTLEKWLTVIEKSLTLVKTNYKEDLEKSFSNMVNVFNQFAPFYKAFNYYRKTKYNQDTGEYEREYDFELLDSLFQEGEYINDYMTVFDSKYKDTLDIE